MSNQLLSEYNRLSGLEFAAILKRLILNGNTIVCFSACNENFRHINDYFLIYDWLVVYTAPPQDKQ